MNYLTVPARTEALADVQAFVEEQLETWDCSPGLQMQTALVAEEIFVNIAHYAYPNGSGDAVIGVQVSGQPPVLTLRFSDWGIPFDPLARSEVDITLSAEERSTGGLGIFLVTPLVNVYRGEENQPGVKRVMKTALKFAIGEGLSMTILLYLFGGYIAELFGLEDAKLIRITQIALRLVSPFFFCTGVLFLQTTYYMIVEKILLSTVITGIKDWLVPCVCIYGFGTVFGISGVWIGLGVAPFFSIVLTLLFVYLRYGREKFPLLLEPDPKAVRIFDVELSKEGIIRLRNQVEAFLVDTQITPGSVNRTMLFIEEMGMLTVEQNRGRKVSCECSVMIGDDVQIIFRDDGITYDPTNADNQVESLRSYVLANLMLSTRDRRSLVTTGYNRSSFRLGK